MRKVDPKSVLDDFVQALGELEGLYEGVRRRSESEKARSHMAELVLMSAAVLWEGFVGDLFVAYINRDSSTFSGYLGHRVKALVEKECGCEASEHVHVSVPKHLKRDQVHRLIDPREYNLTFASADCMITRAGELLPTAAAGKFAALAPAERKSIDAWKQIRNFVAHRSRAAKIRMNAALAESDLPRDLRRGERRVDAVGAFLKATPSGCPTPRIQCYIREMRTIAAQLAR